MKKRVLAFIFAGLTCFSLCAQNLKEDIFNNDLSSLKKKVKLLETDFSGTSILAEYMKSITSSELSFDSKMVSYLIELKADINAKNNDGMAPIHYACSRNKLNELQFLIKNGADVNVTTKNGIPPIYYAIENNNLKMVKTLVEAGCSTTQVWNSSTYAFTEKYGSLDYNDFFRYSKTYSFSPVFWSIFSSNEDILPYLIKKGFSLTEKNFDDQDAFYITAAYLSTNKYYSKANDSYYYNQNVPFHIFANIVTLWKAMSEDKKTYPSDFKPNIYTIMASGDLAAVKKLLVSTGTDTLDYLPYAVLSRNKKILKLILNYNELEINDSSFYGQTLMEWALDNQSMAAVRFLKSQGANYPTNVKYLINAVSKDNMELVKAFVENGTDVNEVYYDDSYSQTALNEAVTNNNLSMVAYLLEHGANTTLGNIINSLKKPAIRNILVKNGAKTDFTFESYCNDIYFDFNQLRNGSSKKTIDMAYYACLYNSPADLKFYLESGIDPKRDEKNASLLYACIFGKSPECLNLLLKTEPTINQKIQKNIGLDYARGKVPQNAKELLEKLIDKSGNNRDKITYTKMLKILEKYPEK